MPLSVLTSREGLFLFAILRRFSRLRCVSTIPRCKGRVATRLRRRERALRAARLLCFHL
nr:MAG TPA: hypothetical protein [Caudoviricetes sp.]